jgi:hypothetical protein
MHCRHRCLPQLQRQFKPLECNIVFTGSHQCFGGACDPHLRGPSSSKIDYTPKDFNYQNIMRTWYLSNLVILIWRWFIPVLLWVIRITVNPVNTQQLFIPVLIQCVLAIQAISSTCFGHTGHHQVDQECKITYTVTWTSRSHIPKICEYIAMLSVYNIKEQPWECRCISK